ncbi:prepilin peptidase [Candidatus Peribacteria bacterium]|nr:prepilin peptidase [Candidatus Peribacteria bacterium]
MVYFLFTIGFFFLGTCVGSFFGTVMETTVKRSFLTGRSQCLTCSHKLQWFELIPVVSYLMQ